MADQSHIEWTDATWNPIVGCSVVSPGCTNCYAMKMAGRLEAVSRAHEASNGGDPGPLEHYRRLTRVTRSGAVWTGTVRQAPEHLLTKPLRWRKGRRIFVNSMSDLFHEDVPDEWIDRVFAVMALCPQHTFQVLTKRADRMRAYLSRHRWHIWAKLGRAMDPECWSALPPVMGGDCTPLPNVWLGVSVEDQQRADERIPDLLATLAAVRFLSCEPLLGPVNLVKIRRFAPGIADREFFDSLTGTAVTDLGSRVITLPLNPPARIDWVICGGESGPGARPMHPDWARSLRDQCAAAGVPFFFKQWGEWGPYDRGRLGDGQLAEPKALDEPLCKFGKKLAGRLLDGVEHNGMPA